MPSAVAVDNDFGRSVDTRRLTLAFVGAVLAVALAAITISNVFASSESETSTVAEGSATLTPVSGKSDGRNGGPLALVGGAPMFPLPGNSSLSSWQDRPVMALDVPVQSMAPQGFWLGSDEVQRVYVEIPAQVVEKGALPLDQLRVGDLIHVSGRMQPAPENLKPLGLNGSAATQLESAKQMLVANSVQRAN